ncbi:MAG: glycine cleavage system protein H [Desulfobacteraceae bacterium]|jgi:glycine cleavage system H lipoate-binding protein
MVATSGRKKARPQVFGIANDQCVWSRAGVVKAMKCVNAFDCLSCSIDQKIQADFESREQQRREAYPDPRPVRMRMLMDQSKCRHMLSGRVTYKLCGHGYDCVKCPYDQMLEDTADIPTLNEPVYDPASGFNVARDYYYHHGHTWARVEYGGRIRVGIDDFAMRMLGPQDEIKLPKLGDRIDQNRPQATLRRSDHEADTLSPVDGKVVAVNSKITTQAKIANSSPYNHGWLMVLQPTNMRKNLKNLLFGIESLAWMEDEAAHLTTLLSEETDYRLAATGGEAIKDIFGAVPHIGWDRLVKTFLS